jgi:hypothetical protein
LAIHKMRGSAHSHDFRTYEITSNGAVVGGPLKNYRGIVTGVPELQLQLNRPAYDGLTDREASVLNTLVRIGAASSDDLAVRIGLPASELKHALSRLVALGYAAVSEEAKGAYRAVAQVGG